MQSAKSLAVVRISGTRNKTDQSVHWIPHTTGTYTLTWFTNSLQMSWVSAGQGLLLFFRSDLYKKAYLRAYRDDIQKAIPYEYVPMRFCTRVWLAVKSQPQNSNEKMNTFTFGVEIRLLYTNNMPYHVSILSLNSIFSLKKNDWFAPLVMLVQIRRYNTPDSTV